MAQAAETAKTSYQGQMHLLQKDMMGRYFERVTRAAEKGEGKAVYMLISGNPVESQLAMTLERTSKGSGRGSSASWSRLPSSKSWANSRSSASNVARSTRAAGPQSVNFLIRATST